MKEIRFFSSEFITDESRKVRGMASIFNVESRDFGSYIEVVHPGFFDDVINDDVVALWDHKSIYPLAKTKNNSLSVGLNEAGLWYEFDMPDTSYANDLMINLKSGLVDESSFGFIVKDEGERIERKDGRLYRHLLKAQKLIDVSPVTLAAFDATSVNLRSIDEFLAKEKSKKPIYIDMIGLDLRLKEIENDYEFKN